MTGKQKNKYICPECGTTMIETYEKPALNLECPNCNCKIATTRWEKIDLDKTIYEVIVLKMSNPSLENIKSISKLTGENFINSKALLTNGFTIYKGKAREIKNQICILDKENIEYKIVPDFPYYR